MSLKATLLPQSPTLARGTSDQHCAPLSSSARPFVSPLFCVNQMAFVRSQTCCVHTHTNIPAQSVGSMVHIQIMHCTLPCTNTHTRGRTRMLKSRHHRSLPVLGGIWGLGTMGSSEGAARGDVAGVRASSGAVCPPGWSQGLLAPLSLT